MQDFVKASETLNPHKNALDDEESKRHRKNSKVSNKSNKSVDI